MLMTLAKYGPKAIYVGAVLRRKATAAGVFPSPITPAFLIGVSLNILVQCRKRTPNRTRRQQTHLMIDNYLRRALERINGTAVPFHDSFDDLMTLHKISQSPSLLSGEKSVT